MVLIVLLVLLSSVATFSFADIANTLAVYQKSTDGAFDALQNNLNVQRQVYNQALVKLTSDINHEVETKVRVAQEQVQNECNRQLYDLNRQFQELTNRTNAETARLQYELQAQAINADARMSEMVKNHQLELARVRSESNAASAQTLNNLRRELEGQIGVAQGEVQRLQSDQETVLRKIQSELESTRKDGETRFRNAQQEIQQQSRKLQQIL